jgi:hypothetical protein
LRILLVTPCKIRLPEPAKFRYQALKLKLEIHLSKIISTASSARSHPIKERKLATYLHAMSFGFSVGDFVAGAQLAYTLCEALSDSKGSAREYQELIAQLNVVHKVLLQVDQLRAAKQLAEATVNALLFTVNSTNETMEAFLDQNEAYHESFKPRGSGNAVKDLFRKGKWATQMSENVRYGSTSEVRDTISDIQVLG